MAKDRYISKEDYKEYEKYKKDKKEGRLLNPEGLMFLAESADYDPTCLGMIMLKNMERFQGENPDLKSHPNVKLAFYQKTDDYCLEDDCLPFIEYLR